MMVVKGDWDNPQDEWNAKTEAFKKGALFLGVIIRTLSLLSCKLGLYDSSLTISD